MGFLAHSGLQIENWASFLLSNFGGPRQMTSSRFPMNRRLNEDIRRVSLDSVRRCRSPWCNFFRGKPPTLFCCTLSSTNEFFERTLRAKYCDRWMRQAAGAGLSQKKLLFVAKLPTRFLTGFCNLQFAFLFLGFCSRCKGNTNSS